MSGYGAGGEAGTVLLRFQIIDVEAHALDLVVPTYITASDLSQRIARDGNLGAYWPDGTRRTFWLRARGRLLGEAEKLSDLGVVGEELLHVLPQPPAGSGPIERQPEYPKTRQYAAAGYLNLVAAFFGMAFWTTLWAIALTVSHFVLLGLLPALGLGLSCVTFARHAMGGVGSRLAIPLVGAGLYIPFLTLAVAPSLVLSSDDLLGVALVALSGLVSGLFGVTLGWLAWYGPVEPLPELKVMTATVSAAGPQVLPCGVCGGQVDMANPEVVNTCSFGCGKVFHVGCLVAKQSVYQGDGCSVCGYDPAAA